MSRSWELFLRDMLESAGKVKRFIVGRELGTFVADEMVYDAVLYNLQGPG